MTETQASGSPPRSRGGDNKPKKPENWFWTREREATLRELHATGKSFAIIGKEFDKTASAISGKCKRLGLRRIIRGAEPSLSGPSRAKPLIGPAPEPIHFPKALRALTTQREGLQVWELPESACQWPLGDPREAGFHFCGGRKVRGAYCATHAFAAYRRAA